VLFAPIGSVLFQFGFEPIAGPHPFAPAGVALGQVSVVLPVGTVVGAP
jgi:hypothetical protein